MNYGDIDERCWAFLLELCQRTNADTSVQASMYEIGEALGLDRDNAKRVKDEAMWDTWVDKKEEKGVDEEGED